MKHSACLKANQTEQRASVQRAAITPRASIARTPVDGVLQLQRSAGNAATHRLIQAKLTVGAAHDPLEQQADRVADQVVSRASIQRNPATDEVQTARDGSMGSFIAGAGFEQRLDNASGGNALDPQTRSRMEAGIGADFSNVRIHTDAQASQLNRSISARAFTRGRDVFFDRGQYNPGSIAGQRLIAHELTHVVQQGGAHGAPAQRKLIQRYPATIATSPMNVDWENQTQSVSKSGEGKSGGVYFFTSNEGAKRKIVIKPDFIFEGQKAGQTDPKHFGEVGASGKVSDAFLQHMGANAPEGRMLTQADEEFNTIIRVAAQKGVVIPRSIDGMSTQYLEYLRVMDVAGGNVAGGAKSVAGLAAEAGSDDGMSRLLSRLSDRGIMRKIGNLLAFDGFMYNNDRVRHAFADIANLGNIMLSSNDVFAIDNNAIFDAVGQTNTDLGDLNNLFSNRAALFNVFFQGINNALPDAMSKGVFAGVLNLYGNTWRSFLSQGVDEGIAKIRVRLGKKNRAALKNTFGETNTMFDIDDGKGNSINHHQHWERLRQRQKYMKLRMGGEDHAGAERGMAAYARYRQARAQKPTGLKWTAKLKYRFGGYKEEA